MHLLPLLQSDAFRPPVGCEISHNAAQVVGVSFAKEDVSSNMLECIQAARGRGMVEMVIQQLLTALLMICFARAIFTDPGSVPNEPEWLPECQPSKRGPEEIGVKPEGESGEAGHLRKLPKSHEVKHTGARRFCKWCNRFKPDRSHHCRVCRSCILRMDHHCPWIANCVGFRNHKYFFLLVFYSLVDCMFVVVTLSESLYKSLVDEMPFSHRFLLVFAMTLAVIMGVLLMMFFFFHVWLMLRATTTIEFCEKTYRHSGGAHRGSSSIYDRGFFENVQSVLGPNMMTWLLPVSPPEGDGLSFKVSEEVEPVSDEEDLAPLLRKHYNGGASGSAPLPPQFEVISAKVSEGDKDDSTAVVDTIPPEVTGAQQSIS